MSVCPLCSVQGKPLWQNQFAHQEKRYWQWVCQGCGVWFSPQEDADAVGAEDYFHQFETVDSQVLLNKAKRTLSLFHLENALSVCEIGPGRGEALLALKARSPSLDLLALDLSHQLVEKLKNSGIRAFVYPNLPNQKVDLVLASHVIEHFHHPREFIEIVHKLLKPKGRLVLLCPNRDNFFIRQGRIPNLNLPHHRFYYSFQEIQNMLIQSGFTIEEAKTLERNRFQSNLEQANYNALRENLDLFRDVFPLVQKMHYDPAVVTQLENALEKHNLGSETFVVASL